MIKRLTAIANISLITVFALGFFIPDVYLRFLILVLVFWLSCGVASIYLHCHKTAEYSNLVMSWNKHTPDSILKEEGHFFVFIFMVFGPVMIVITVINYIDLDFEMRKYREENEQS